MSDPNHQDLDRITDYVTGELSPHERAETARWIADDRERQAWADAFQAAHRTIGKMGASSADEGRVIQAVLGYTNISKTTSSTGSSSSCTNRPLAGAKRGAHSSVSASFAGRRALKSAFWGVAAIVLLVAGALVFRTGRTFGHVQRYHTLPGERSTVRLADGATLLLAPATSVSVTSEGIAVTGEVYFTVAPHPSLPFIVRTPNAVAQVLGTRFTVRHYPNETRSRVVVQDGKVALRVLGSRAQNVTATVLSTRMMAQVTDSGITVTPDISVDTYTAWTRGQLVFREMPLHEVVAELARAYGADIRVTDSALAQRLITLKVSVSQEPLPQVLSGIGLVTNAHYARVDHTFILAPGPIVPPVQQVKKDLQPEKQYGR